MGGDSFKYPKCSQGQPIKGGGHVKYSLKDGQTLRLLSFCGACNLVYVGTPNYRSTYIMNAIHIVARVVSALLSAVITIGIGLVFQFGHLA